MNADGSHQRVLSHGYAENPSWSPDGLKIAYDDGSDIWVMSTDGSGARRLTSDRRANEPSWSPDGSQIVFVDGSDIDVMNADGRDRHPIRTDVVGDGAYEVPSWSPDGKRIAFSYWPRNGGVGLAAMNPDGSHYRALTPGGGHEYDMYPSWSPDSKRIAFVGEFDQDETLTDTIELTRTAPHARKPSRLLGPTEDAGYSDLDWSPDGHSILYSDGRQVFRLGLDGQAQELTRNRRWNLEPAWSRTRG
jgi:Tol biopolymer transport system component